MLAADVVARGMPPLGAPQQSDILQRVLPGWTGGGGDLSIELSSSGLCSMEDAGGGGVPASSSSAGKRRPGVSGPCLAAVCLRDSSATLAEANAQRSLQMADAGAYLHWFSRFGCEVEQLREAAHRMLDIAACYRHPALM
jgi:hypothetical protein